MYSVLYWGSHPDLENDDLWYVEDISDFVTAQKKYHEEVLDSDVAFVEFDGPEMNLVRANPHFRKGKTEREDRMEAAMQAGMAFGCDGYNDVMGY